MFSEGRSERKRPGTCAESSESDESYKTCSCFLDEYIVLANICTEKQMLPEVPAAKIQRKLLSAGFRMKIDAVFLAPHRFWPGKR